MKGEILLELGPESKDLQFFTSAVKATIGETGVVRNLVPRITLELLDLDSTTTKEELEMALQLTLEENNGDMKVSVSKSNMRGQILAFVKINEQV